MKNIGRKLAETYNFPNQPKYKEVYDLHQIKNYLLITIDMKIITSKEIAIIVNWL